MYFLLSILSVFIALFILFILLGLYRTWKTQHHPKQKEFLVGKIPADLPNGYYRGVVSNYKGPWIGKKFNAKQKRGTNIFLQNAKHVEAYPFVVSIGKRLQEKKVEVIKLDYNMPENPFWIRFIVDEIVAIQPNVYLGKIHIRLLPFFPFSIGYFELEKNKE